MGVKRVYSGFDENIRKPRGRFNLPQIISFGVVAVMLFLMLRQMGANDENGQEAAREISNARMRFYYYTEAEVDYDIVYVDRLIIIDSGRGLLSAFEKGMKSPPEDDRIFKAIADEAVINYVTTDGKSVTVDFNNNFITYGMDYARETAMLMAVACTFADYFNVSRVAVTIEGEPYRSRNFEFDENYFIETRTVDAAKY